MRAAVIHVLAFLSLCGDRATIIGTLEQTRKGEGVLPVFRFIPSREWGRLGVNYQMLRINVEGRRLVQRPLRLREAALSLLSVSLSRSTDSVLVVMSLAGLSPRCRAQKLLSVVRGGRVLRSGTCRH